MVRNPIVAGQFYPGVPDQLRAMISGLIDERAEKTDVLGLVSPHAGYVYSGAVAGAVLSRIRFTDTFVILGPNHSGRGKGFSIMTEGTWRTPLGDVEIDSELGRQILAESDRLEQDYAAHQYEHSIEVQVPFLQYFKSNVRIVPIVLAHYNGAAYKEIGTAIAGAIKGLGRKAVIIASSDMTHYEPQEVAKRKDTSAIEAILDLNEDELMKRVKELNISMCGYAPVVSLITASRALGAARAELIKYKTSGDISGDYGSVVGYAGIIIRG